MEMSYRLREESEAFLRKFIKELFGIEPTKIVLFDDNDRKRLNAEDLHAWFEPETGRIFVQTAPDHGIDLEAFMHEVIHMWKPNWSEEHIEKAAQHLAEIFRIYAKEQGRVEG